MSMSMSTDVFYEMPSDPNLYESQYDVKAGHWPENHNEVVLVLTGNGNISDFMLYTLGLRDANEFDDMVKKFAAEEEVTTPDNIEQPTYDDILGITFKLVQATDYYVHDDEFNVWKDKTDDTDYMRNLVNNGEDVKIVGIVQPREDATATMLSSGINYPSTLTDYVIEQAASSTIVKDQLAHPDTNVFTDKPFGEEDDGEGFDMQSLFTIDGDAIQAAFKFDESALTSGLSGMSLDLSGLSLDMGSLPAFDGSSIALDPSSIDMSNLVDFSDIKLDLGDVQPTMDSAKMQAAMEDIMAGFNPWYANWAQEQVAQGKVPTMEDGAKAYLESEEVQKKIADAIMGSIDMKQATEALQTQLQQQLSAKMQQAVPAMAQALESQLQASITTAMSSYMQNVLGAYMQQMQTALETQVSAAMQQSMNQIAANMSNAMSIDESAFANAFQMNMDENDLTELMMSMMGKEDASYDNNLKKLLRRLQQAERHRHLPHRLREQREGHRHPRRLQRPHDRRRRRRQGDHLHRLRGHAHGLGHRHREHDQLRAGGVRGHLAGGVVHHDRRHHLHFGAGTQEGDRHPALHRRQQGRHQPRVQRRDHHRGLHGRRHRHRPDHAGLHTRQRHRLLAVRRGERGLAAVAGRRHPGGHQRVPHVPGRPHPLQRRQQERPGGSAEKRVSEAAPHKPEQTEEALLFCKSASFPRQDERGGVFHRPSRLPRTLLWTFREIPDGHRLPLAVSFGFGVFYY